MSTDKSQEAISESEGHLDKDDFDEEEAHGEATTKLARADIAKMLERHGVDADAIDELEDDDASTDEGASAEAGDDDDDDDD